MSWLLSWHWSTRSDGARVYDLITKNGAETVLEVLLAVPEKDRRAFARPAAMLFKKIDQYRYGFEKPDDVDVSDMDAVTVAVLLTASGSELKKMSFFPEPARLSLEDVWRFFEVEGGGEDSLANYEKYCKTNRESWAGRLKRFSEEGKLDRQRLLDASLDASDRDFAQYRAG